MIDSPRIQGSASAASRGVVIGRAYTLASGDVRVSKLHLGAEALEREEARFAGAVESAIGELTEEIRRLSALGHQDVAAILDAHRMMLEDGEFSGAIRKRIREQAINAEWAVHCHLEFLRQIFSDFQDEYLRERFQDVWHIGQRLLLHLQPADSLTRWAQSNLEGRESCVFVARDVAPAHLIALWRMGAAGLIVEQGGGIAHNIIVARDVGLPMLVGVRGLIECLQEGDRIILDAEQSRFILHPSNTDIAEYRRFMSALQVIEHDLRSFAHRPSRSRDGRPMALMANVEFHEEMPAVKACGAEGIGLFRTEFTFLRDALPPDESRQYQQYLQIIRSASGQPCTFRLLDIGGDKPALFQHLTGSEANTSDPRLGLRGVRLLLNNRQVLRAQLRALLRASQHGDLRILIPMVNWVEEVESVRSLLRAEAEDLGIDTLPAVGCMIETPAAVMIADSLAAVSDFFSIGSNDLIQYTLAESRDDEERGHHLASEHPAIRNFIRSTVKAAQRAGIAVSVCGELAGSTEWTRFFLNLGVDSLSMAPHRILPVRSLLSRLRYEPE